MIKLGIYKHYKGNFYELLGLCRHSETLEELVYYKALYGNFRYWVRPVSLFTGEVEYEGKLVPRFSFINETLTNFPEIRK